MKALTLVALLFLSTCLAQTILKVDFNSVSGSVASPNLPGFQAFNVPLLGLGPTSVSYTYATDPELTTGAVTLMLEASIGNMNSRNRSGVFPENGNLFSDFVVAIGNGQSMTITLDGLLSDQDYAIKFFAFDNDANVQANSSSQVFETLTSGQITPTTGTIAYGGGFVSTELQSLTLRAISASDGTLVFKESAGLGSYQQVPILNGMEITMIPEAKAAIPVIVLLGIVAAIKFRRN